MSRVLVTGGTGFIGSHLVRALEGHTLAVTSRVQQDLPGVEVLEVDIRHRDRCRVITDWNPDIVFHLAAYHHVGRSFEQVEECFDVNAKGSANVIDATDAHIIYMSTSEVYGLQRAFPWSEDLTPRPQSPYGVSKLAGEHYALLQARRGKRIAVARPFNTYGPGQSSRAVLGKFVKLALAGAPIVTTPGKQTREFNYVTDVVDGLCRIAELEFVGGPVNIGGGEEVSIASALEQVLELTGSRSVVEDSAPYRPNEIWRMKASTVKMGMELDHSPKVSFREGLERMIAWHRSAF